MNIVWIYKHISLNPHTSLLAQPQEKWLSTAPAARIGRLTMSGMSAGGTAATTDGPVAPLPEEPMLTRAEVQAPHPAELLLLQVPSQWILEAGAATSRDQAQGATGSVAQYELQPGKREGSGDGPPLDGLWRGADAITNA